MLHTDVHIALALHTQLLESLVADSTFRVWLVLDVTTNSCKAVLTFHRGADGDLTIDTILVNEKYIHGRYHEALMLLLVTFADRRNYIVHLTPPFPCLGIVTLLVGFLGFLNDDDTWTRPATVAVGGSQNLLATIRHQMCRLYTEQRRLVARSDPDTSQSTAVATE